MIISPKNLGAGINWWKTTKKNWGEDFVNCEYYKIYSDRLAGTTNEWWNHTLDRLSGWRALRSPLHLKEEDYRALGAERLGTISDHYRRILSLSSSEPVISELRWDDIAHLVEVVAEIKPRSSMFASKMCHFLFPKLFLVMDNEATGISQYEVYWRGMREAWLSFSDKEILIDMLKRAIHTEAPIHPLYPWETKILELCHIGANIAPNSTNCGGNSLHSKEQP